MRVSIIILLVFASFLEEIRGRKLWPGFAKGRSYPGAPNNNDNDNINLNNNNNNPGGSIKPSTSSDLGTESMLGKLFDLGKQKSKENETHFVKERILYEKGSGNPVGHWSPSSKKSGSKSEADFATIAKAISTLAPTDFAEDTQLVLEKGEGGTSIYRHLPGEKRGSVVFRRPSDDEGKQLVLLSRAEDHLRIARTKRTYVVLKQNPQFPNRYFVIYAYIRTNGKTMEKEVEWDIWDARGKTNQKNRPFGWTDCKQTNLVSCKSQPPPDAWGSNDTPEYEDEDDMAIPDDGNESESVEFIPPPPVDVQQPDNLNPSPVVVENALNPPNQVNALNPSNVGVPNQGNTLNPPNPTNQELPNAVPVQNSVVNSPAAVSNQVKRQVAPGVADPQAPFNDLVRAAAKILERTMADAKYDYFLDLRDDPVEAKLVGLTVDLVTKGVTTLSVSEQVTNASIVSLEENSKIVTKVLDALEASVKNFAGATSVLGLLVGGVDNLGKKNGTNDVLGDFEAKLGKKFLENILNKRGGRGQLVQEGQGGQAAAESVQGNNVNPNPAELLDPQVVAKLSTGGSSAQGRGILGGKNEGGLLGNLGSVLGLSGLFDSGKGSGGGSGSGKKKNKKEEAEVEYEEDEAAPALKKGEESTKKGAGGKKAKEQKMMGEGISQKALATALMKSAAKEKAKLYAGLPDGTKVPEDEVAKEGVPLREMPTGGLAMLGNGDMVHKLPSGGFVLLPKAGGLIHMSAKEISQKYGDPKPPKKKKKKKVNPADKPDKNGIVGPGLLGGLTNVVSGLLNNVGTVLKGGPVDEKGESQGIIRGVGGLVTDLLNGVNEVINGKAGHPDNDEEDVVYEYEGDVAQAKAKGRAFDAAPPVVGAAAPISVGNAAPPVLSAAAPNAAPPVLGAAAPNAAPPVLGAAAPISVGDAAQPVVVGLAEPTTVKPFSPSDCITRRPGLKTWYDPLGLYPDPSDPCYFAPVAAPTFQSVAPAVPPYNPYAYSYPFYPYFGRRKRREVPEKASGNVLEKEEKNKEETSSKSDSKIEPKSESKSESRDEKAKKGRGWLFGNGSQKGNGCDGILGVIGTILGNRKGCDNRAQDTLTVIGKDGNMVYSNKGDGTITGMRVVGEPPQNPGSEYTMSSSVQTYTLPPGSPGPNPVLLPPPGQSLSIGGGAPVGLNVGLSVGEAPGVSLSIGGTTGLGLGLNLGASAPAPLPLPPSYVAPPSNPEVFDPSTATVPPGLFAPPGKRKRSIGSPEHEVFEVPPPVTRSEILARVASQLIHEIAATAVGVAQPPPVVLPGKSPLRGSNLIDAGLDVLQYPPQQGRSLGQEDTIKAGLTEVMETDLFSHIGWLTQAYSQTSLSQAAEARKAEVFIGFGTCPYVPMNIKEANSPEKVIDFYLNLMRTGCDAAEAKKLFMGLVFEGCIHIIQLKGNSALQLQKTCKYVSLSSEEMTYPRILRILLALPVNFKNKPKLTKQELVALSKAFELAVFSQAYCAEMDNKEEYSDGVSKTVRTLKDMVILAFRRGRSVAHFHLIKLTRSIVRTVKTALTKSLQDLVRYQSCSECTKVDQEGASADVRALMEVIEYIIANADPSKVDWQSYHEYTDNPNPAIDKRLKYYFVH